jgi:hypothetical protein
MAGWISDTVTRWAVSLAAWAQDRYFEPEHYQAPWVVYSHDGIIDLCDTAPVLAPTHAMWQRVMRTKKYTRVDVPVVSHEAPTTLPLPIIQVVVRLNSHGRLQRRSKANPRDFDITNEMVTFGGYPKLDWMHVGLCVKHRYDVEVYPGQYTLSIIDGQCNLIELDEVAAAVFSVGPPPPTPPQPLPTPPPLADTLLPSAASGQQEGVGDGELEIVDEDPEPLPWDYESDSDDLGNDEDVGDDSDPEPDFEE